MRFFTDPRQRESSGTFIAHAPEALTVDMVFPDFYPQYYKYLIAGLFSMKRVTVAALR